MNPEVKIQKNIFSLIGDDRIQEARKKCVKLIQHYPKSEILYKALGLINHRLKKYKLGINYFKKSIACNAIQPDVLNNIGICYKEEGDLKNSIKYYKKAIGLDNKYEDAFVNLGISNKDMLDYSSSIINFEKALSINPRNTVLLLYIGIVFYKWNKFDLSIKSLLNFISNNPDSIDGFYNIALSYKKLKEIDKSIFYFKKALNLDENHIEANLNLANCYFDIENFSLAEKIYLKIYSIKPNFVENIYNLGNLYMNIEDFNKAEGFFYKVLDLEANHSSTYNCLGVIKRKQSKVKDAKVLFEKSINIDYDFIDPLINLGILSRENGDYKNAVSYYQKAMEIDKNNTNLLLNFAVTLTDLKNYEKANDFYEKIIKLNPNYFEAYYNLSINFLRLKQFKKGWEYYDWRWKADPQNFKFLKTNKPIWSGDYREKVYIWSEQGLGDEIMFSTIINEVSLLFKNSIIGVDERLVEIFYRSFPTNIKFISNKTFKNYEFDSHIPIGNLLKVFRKSLKSFEKNSFLLTKKNLKPNILKEYNKIPKDNHIIGISWFTENKAVSQKRNIDLLQLIKTIPYKKVTFINLQYGNFEKDVEKVIAKLGAKFLNTKDICNYSEIDDLLTLISFCDKVVSIDNSTVHLSGSIGKDTRVILPYSADWRWGVESKKSYWYKNIHLYRQKNPFDWEVPLAELKKDLQN